MMASEQELHYVVAHTTNFCFIILLQNVFLCSSHFHAKQRSVGRIFYANMLDTKTRSCQRGLSWWWIWAASFPSIVTIFTIHATPRISQRIASIEFERRIVIVIAVAIALTNLSFTILRFYLSDKLIRISFLIGIPQRTQFDLAWQWTFGDIKWKTNKTTSKKKREEKTAKVLIFNAGAVCWMHDRRRCSIQNRPCPSMRCEHCQRPTARFQIYKWSFRIGCLAYISYFIILYTLIAMVRVLYVDRMCIVT